MKRILPLLLVLCLLLPQAALGQSKPRDYYEIFVASYYDSDGDGTGDLNGIAQKLPAIMDLGATGIWLMPIHPSPSYHKYDVADYYAVDPAYGTMADFESLAALCRENDVALILDLVMNHTSLDHPWFQKAVQGEKPYADFYHFFDEPGTNRHLLPNGRYYEGVFGSHMPDLNLENGIVFEELCAVAAFWLQKGATGFRLDALMHYREKDTAFNNLFIEKFKSRFPDTYLVGEVWADAETINRYYGGGIDSLFNYPFATQDGNIVKAIRQGTGAALAQKIADWQEKIRAVNPDALDAPFLSNHDNGRSSGYFALKPELQKLAAAVYLLMPGSPFIYYGEELGMTGSGKDENKRQPYPWSLTDLTGIPNPPPGTDQTQRLTEGYLEQQENPESLLNTYRAILAAKKRCPVLYTGSVAALDLGNPALCAYTVLDEAQNAVVVHNFSGDTAVFSLDGKEVILPAFQSLLFSNGINEVF